MTADRASTATLDALRVAVGDPEQVRTRPLDLHAHAHDASHFLLIPSALVVARDAGDVSRLLQVSAAQGVPLAFRSGGTSLSGQAQTDGIMVDVRRNFKDIEVLDGGLRVRVQPGVTVRALNARLAPYGRKFGPDPASEGACTIGGVVANNSSGMECGTVQNAYQTLESLTVVLPSGTVLDTGQLDADQRLRALEPEIHDGLLTLATRLRRDPASVARVRQQFSMKNTMGYGVNSLLDFDRPVDMLAHLIVGSEGTLGFVAEAVFRTVPRRTDVTTALLVFDDLLAANTALPALVETGAATVELMDALSLRVGQGLSGCPAVVAGLEVRDHAALLVEYQADDAAGLADAHAVGMRLVADLPLSAPARFTSEVRERSRLWRLRKGLYAAVAGARAAGTTAVLEDVVVPVPALGRTCTDLIDLFAKYDYHDAVIFGHAKDGNIHFMLTSGFTDPADLERYSDFTEDMVDLVLGEGGSLKAEHGTGRVMAPYVRRQYGDEIYDVMRGIKAVVDPRGMLNPGVLLDDDPTAHLQNIKSAPAVAPEIDRCVTCGYCEPVCPSRNITMTPRQRIVVLRAIEQARIAGDTALVASLEKDYQYDGIHTCAVDGMCKTACPVGIDTGVMIKKLRAQNAAPVPKAVWGVAAKHWAGTTRVAGAALSTLKVVPTPLVLPPDHLARAALGTDNVPLYSAELPGGGPRRARPAPTTEPEAVYFPACVQSMFGPVDGSPGVQASFEELCAKAGVALLVPEGIDGLCCGTPWSSKGMTAGEKTMRDRTLAALRDATRDGALPIVCDAASCTEGLLQAVAKGSTKDGGAPLVVMDAVAFVATRVVPHLGTYAKKASLALHPTCSTTRMGINEALELVASAVAEEVQVAEHWGCCGYAGDRGMLHPELTASATAGEAADVLAGDAEEHASCNRTCELGMTRATGKPYKHIIEALAEVALE
ncbi:FAD-binding and (Fe-S)-binding domain-containing protein [Cellulomonas fengjieae]|uniref:FAD-binding and (Fe-S)-binding domain-containing protein n=1 Tax=Cellulomonas fengjieae TaxID=2819978 RepID=UPI0027DD8C46|nr:FAD-binding and (Fe-S)-binding domain-containing protein [Cellulomonas fengjieae]